MAHHFVPERIYKTLGKDIKLIFMLRNPASRAFSHYLMSLRRGYEILSFEEAIKIEYDRIKEDDTDKKWLSRKNNFSYIDRGYYATQIKRYLKFFPKENMHFILFEDEFLKDKKSTINGVCEFLNIEPNNTLIMDIKSNPATESKFIWLRNFLNQKSVIKMFLPRKIKKIVHKKIEKINSKTSLQKLSPDLKKKIIEKYYLDDIVELEKLINKNLTAWYQ